MNDCSTEEHRHKQIKKFKIYRKKNATPRQKAFALMYCHYIDFPTRIYNKKQYALPSFFSDIRLRAQFL